MKTIMKTILSVNYPTLIACFIVCVLVRIGFSMHSYKKVENKVLLIYEKGYMDCAQHSKDFKYSQFKYDSIEFANYIKNK